LSDKEFAEDQLDERFSDIIALFDSTQRAQANMQQMLRFLVEEVKDWKRRQREGRA